jgi:hypothetical protein
MALRPRSRFGKRVVGEPTDDAVARHDRYFWVTATVLLSSLLIALVVQFPTGTGPIGGRGAQSPYSTVWPQRWTFFTRLTERSTVVLYRVDGTNPRLTSRPSEAERLWGLNRVGETEYIFGSWLAARIPAADWRTCRDPDPAACVNDQEQSKVLRLTRVAAPSVWCGRVAVVREGLVRDDVRMIALVDVDCLS